MKSYNLQIFKENNVEITFEKSQRIAGNTQYRIKLNKYGKTFVAKNLSEDLYDLFLSRITAGEIVDTIEDLVTLLSDLH